MAREIISLITNEESAQKTLQYKLDNGLISKTDYDAMDVSDQERVRKYLFDMYSERTINQYSSLSALEFQLMGVTKLLLKLIEGSSFTDEENKFIDKLAVIVGKHEMPIKAETWEMDYLNSQVDLVVKNRQDYVNAKTEVTGTF